MAINAFFKLMKNGGRISQFYETYKDDKASLKLMVTNELQERSRDERLSILTKITTELANILEKKSKYADA